MFHLMKKRNLSFHILFVLTAHVSLEILLFYKWLLHLIPELGNNL